MPPSRADVEKFLKSEINGKHGESERRAAAQFVLDAMEGNDPGDKTPAEWAGRIADYFAEAVEYIAREVRALELYGGPTDAGNDAR